ncbi:protein transport protein SEC31-like isoform X2 [Agrilus planipennis]|nr:protein transport protein SEC31-like isoform X2 [Agrilus planipennis]XP_025836222.1 protein transport protein SEC31-like isoform X2 [Agrilus planipennis]XP_025836224.1 protein transport protein SEC31-like isoform X2 [Agrilus planipennis]
MKNYHPLKQSFHLPLSKGSDAQHAQTAFYPYQFPSYPANLPLPQSYALPFGQQASLAALTAAQISPAALLSSSPYMSNPYSKAYGTPSLPQSAPLPPLHQSASLPSLHQSAHLPSLHQSAPLPPLHQSAHLPQLHQSAPPSLPSQYALHNAIPYGAQFQGQYNAVPKYVPPPPPPPQQRGHQLPTMEEFRNQRTPPFYTGVLYYKPQREREMEKEKELERQRELNKQREIERQKEMERQRLLQTQTQKPLVKHSGEVYSFNIYNSPPPNKNNQPLHTPAVQQSEAPMILNQTMIQLKEQNIQSKSNYEVLANQNITHNSDPNLQNENLIISANNSTSEQQNAEQQNLAVPENSQQPANQTNSEVITHNINAEIKNVVEQVQAPITQNPVFRAFHVRHRTEIPSPTYPGPVPPLPRAPNPAENLIYNPFLYNTKPEDIALGQAFFPQLTAQLNGAVTLPAPIITTEAAIPPQQPQHEEQQTEPDRRDLSDDEVEARIKADFSDESHYKKNREEEDDGDSFFTRASKPYNAFESSDDEREEEESESAEEF